MVNKSLRETKLDDRCIGDIPIYSESEEDRAENERAELQRNGFTFARKVLKADGDFIKKTTIFRVLSNKEYRLVETQSSIEYWYKIDLSSVQQIIDQLHNDDYILLQDYPNKPTDLASYIDGLVNNEDAKLYILYLSSDHLQIWMHNPKVKQIKIQ